MNPNQCPKWAGCNAPVCPLDSHYRSTRTHNGEPTCLYLREAVKQSDSPHIPEHMREPVRKCLHIVMVDAEEGAGHGVLRAKLQQAQGSGSKLAQGRARGFPPAVVQDTPKAIPQLTKAPPQEHPMQEAAA